jgi:hypothetical protein
MTLRAGLRNFRNMSKPCRPEQVCYCWPLCPLFQMFRDLFVVLSVIATAAAASPEPDSEKLASALYARGLAGDQQAVIGCIATLEQILVASPDNQLARVYLGSAYTLRSRDLGLGKAKLDALRKGIALMDVAAAGAPENARVQLIRAVTNEALPVFLGRRSVAHQQLEQVVGQVEKDPGKLKPADRQLLYLNAGEAAKHAGNPARAAELWRRGAAINADPGLTQKIRAALDQP